MSPRSKTNPSSLSEGNIQGGTESPTQPGVFWFQCEPMSRALMVEVRVTSGQLTVWWPNQAEPVANLKGRWRGPDPSLIWTTEPLQDAEKVRQLRSRIVQTPKRTPKCTPSPLARCGLAGQPS